MECTFDYIRLWRTLLKLGIKDSFNAIRNAFFMTVAKDGAVIYGPSEMEKIMEDSMILSRVPEFKELVEKAIPPEDKYKHHAYYNNQGTIFIEYFANVSNKFPKEFYERINMEGTEIDGHCSSIVIELPAVAYNDDGTVDEEASSALSPCQISAHLILIGEGSGIEPELYPGIIKHELTHVALFELKRSLNADIFSTVNIPSSWTDEETSAFAEDVKYLMGVLTGETEESKVFIEFVCEFLMYEADGVVKIKNPTVDTRAFKTSKDIKPKVTYRSNTPFERYETVVDIYDDSYRETYQHIIESLRPYYADYDKFLESIRM